MGDRVSVVPAGRRRGASRLVALGAGTLMFMGALSALTPAEAMTSATGSGRVVVQNADFGDGTSGWRSSTNARAKIIGTGPIKAIEVRNKTKRRTTVFASSALSPDTFPAGTKVTVRAQMRTTSGGGKLGMNLREHALVKQVNKRSATPLSAKNTYRKLSVTMTTTRPTSRLSVQMVQHRIKGGAALRVRAVAFEVTLPSTSTDPGGTGDCADLNDAAQRRLVFADEFSGASLDTSRWNVRDKTSLSFDAAYITRDAIRVGGGHLTIAGRRMAQAKRVSGGMAERVWSTGYIDTIGKFSQQYGRWEMRAKLPTDEERTRGVWPAFWLRGDRTGGEIDIMESYGSPDSQAKYNPSRSYQATLWEDTNLGKAEGKGHWATWAHKDWQTHNPPIYRDYHVYGINWTAECMQFTFDDDVVATVRTADLPWTKKAFASPMNIRLNMQVGSPYWGMPNDTQTKPAFDYVIDYVRAYAPR